MPGMPPVPQLPGVGGTAPASPMQPNKGGDEARQRVLMGLALIVMSKAHGIAPLSGDAPEIAKFLEKFGKKFPAPDPSLGKSELKYLDSQLPSAGPQGGQPPQGSPGTPPPPPMPPMAQQAA